MLLKAEKFARRTEFFRTDLPHERVKVGPRHGEVVGQGWEQMSTMKGTKAKTMMEKMGWKEGEGLGKEANKGIAEPIQHVVRYSKAGLG
jgi:G-patch domain